MTRNYRGLLLVPILSGILFAAEPFYLRFPELSQGWYPSGAVVHVPRKIARRMEVRLDKNAASQVQIGEIDLTWDGQYPKFDRARSAGDYIFTATTREPVGLLVNDEHRIEATTGSKHPYKGEWRIQRWDKSYVQSTLVGPQNNEIDIRIDQPFQGTVMVNGDSSSASVRLSGEILGHCDCRLTIAGQEVQRQVTKPGFQFDVQIPVAAKTREIEVKANDDTGSMTSLYLPVLWHSGH